MYFVQAEQYKISKIIFLKEEILWDSTNLGFVTMQNGDIRNWKFLIPWMGQSVGYSEVLLNDDLSFEERQEFAAHAEDGFKDYLPDYDWSRVTEYEAPGCIDEPDAPPVKMLVANPKEKWSYKRNSPCILIIPGGGLTTCFRFTADIENWADKFGVPVATLTYRTLCQEAQYPAPVRL